MPREQKKKTRQAQSMRYYCSQASNIGRTWHIMIHFLNLSKILPQMKRKLKRIWWSKKPIRIPIARIKPHTEHGNWGAIGRPIYQRPTWPQLSQTHSKERPKTNWCAPGPWKTVQSPTVRRLFQPNDATCSKGYTTKGLHGPWYLRLASIP